jgi:hypothetical protein
MNRWLMVGVYLLTPLIAAACAKGRYTDDHHYVGNPERPPATSESSTRDREERTPADTNSATTR